MTILSASHLAQPRLTLGAMCAFLWTMASMEANALTARHLAAFRSRRNDRLNRIVLAELSDHLRRDIGAPLCSPRPQFGC